MMKSLMRWGATIGIVAATVFNTGFDKFKALALPNEQVLQILGPVPVFILLNPDTGALITFTLDQNSNEVPEELKDINFVRVFMNHNDAKKFLDEEVVKVPELAENTLIHGLSLASVFEESQKEEYKEQNLVFQYVATQESQTNAQEILAKKGQQFNGGVPLFFVTEKSTGSPVPAYENNDPEKPIISFFFEKDELDDALQESNLNQEEFNANYEISVTLLSKVIETLVLEEDEVFQKVRFDISSDSEELLRQRQQESSPNAQE
ncbi:MAG: Tic22 family protein [Cyanobacteria bacterium P01_F01_bin.143]